MDPYQQASYNTTQKRTNPIVSTFKEVLFTQPGQQQQSTTPTTPTTYNLATKQAFPVASTPVTAPTVGQGQRWSQGQGQGFVPSEVTSTTTSTTYTTVPAVSTSVPVSTTPVVQTSTPSFVSSAPSTTFSTSSGPSSASSSSSSWKNLDYLSRSEKEEPVFESVSERAKSLELLLESKKLETRMERILANNVETPHLETSNTNEGEFPNEIPMPPALPGSTSHSRSHTTSTPAPKESFISSSVVQPVKSTIHSATVTASQTVQHAKDTAASTLAHAKESASSTLTSVKDTTASTLSSVKDTATHTLATAKEQVAHTLDTVRDTTSATLGQVKESTAHGLATARDRLAEAREATVTRVGEARDRAAPYVEKMKERARVVEGEAAGYARQGYNVARERATVYGQEGLETAKDTAVYGAHAAVENLPLVRQYARVFASWAGRVLWTLFYLVLEGIFLAKEFATTGWNMVQERRRLQRQQQPTTSTTSTSTSTRRAPLKSSLRRRTTTTTTSTQPKSTSWSSTSTTSQPAFVVGEKVTLSYEEAHRRVVHMTEAALDKMNSMMASSNVMKDQHAWKEAEHNLQQFAQFTVKSLWDFVDSIQMDREQKKQLSNEALLCEKKIWDRLSHFETKSFAPIFQQDSSFGTGNIPLKVTETTIINSAEGTKRFSGEHIEA